MILVKKENRDIFSICINYRYAEEYGVSNTDFLKAHLAEHLMVVNVCRQFQKYFGEKVGVEKYISGLTNIESSCFQLSESNQYICYAKDFVEMRCNHNLDYITEKDLSEQEANVLKEYDYPDNSFRGRCNEFYNYINDLDEIDYEKEIEQITFDEIRDFIDKRFITNKCDIFYCGKSNNEVQTKALQWSRNAKPKRICKTFSCHTRKRNIYSPNNQNSQIWFAYQFFKLQSIHDYIISEIVAKTIQIAITLSNKSSLEIQVINVGTHYTDICAYALFVANTTYNNLKFDYSREEIYIIIDAVKKEYETRLLLKNDSLLETIKFYKKIFYITMEVDQQIDIKSVFNKIDTREIYKRFEEIYATGAKTIMQFIKD